MTKEEKVEALEVSDKKQETRGATEDNSERTYNLCYIVQLSLIGSIGGFLLGYDTGIIAGAQVYFDSDWPEIQDS